MQINKSKIKSIASNTLMFSVIGLVVLSMGNMVVNSFQEMQESNKKNDQTRVYLLAEAKKSNAHQFLVANWMKCRPIVSTPAGCYTGIRGAAAAHGDTFVHEVDQAAKSMNLI